MYFLTFTHPPGNLFLANTIKVQYLCQSYALCWGTTSWPGCFPLPDLISPLNSYSQTHSKWFPPCLTDLENLPHHSQKCPFPVRRLAFKRNIQICARSEVKIKGGRVLLQEPPWTKMKHLLKRYRYSALFLHH